MHHNIAVSRVFKQGELCMNSPRMALAMKTMFVASAWLLMWTVAASAQVKVLMDAAKAKRGETASHDHQPCFAGSAATRACTRKSNASDG